MKKIGQYTAKGQLRGDGQHRITLFDGRFDTGYRVTKFVVAGGFTNEDRADFISVKLATTTDLDSNAWNWDDNREIGWAQYSYYSNSAGTQFGGPSTFSEIDPDNMIIEDLYVYVQTRNEFPVNYMIEFEKYEITEWQGALGMVRNQSQG